VILGNRTKYTITLPATGVWAAGITLSPGDNDVPQAYFDAVKYKFAVHSLLAAGTVVIAEAAPSAPEETK
jgi:hypothetical protein